jgi:putative restriction endonuclease
MATHEQWLATLANLHVYRAKHGPAPHKPLLLLVVLELAEEGQLPPEVLQLTPELAFRFSSYWTIVAHRRTQAPDVRMPFHHLEKDGRGLLSGKMACLPRTIDLPAVLDWLLTSLPA